MRRGLIGVVLVSLELQADVKIALCYALKFLGFQTPAHKKKIYMQGFPGRITHKKCNLSNAL